MPRRKLSEYRAKTIVHDAIGLSYTGWEIDSSRSLATQLKKVKSTAGSYVVKVDQGVKGRFKKGLVLLDVKYDDLGKSISSLAKKGFDHFIVEPFVKHEPGGERYLSLALDRAGTGIAYSLRGGVDIESYAESVEHILINQKTDWSKLVQATGLSELVLRSIAETFTTNHMVFLEINPYLIAGTSPSILDIAVEVDDAGEYFVDKWSSDDFRIQGSRTLTPQELSVQTLDAKSPASFKLDVINPNGSIFLLLSGGGASIVVADEVYASGRGKDLGNYGEYSGNPNTEETYLYTRAVLELLVASKAKNKVLIVGGAVANFTDIANTFSGVIMALDELAGRLKSQGVRVFVRRGGPRQEVGLAKIEAALSKHGLLGAVHDPKTSLTAVVGEALQGVKK